MAGEVLTCVEFDATTATCTAQAWMPAPSIVPPLSTVDAVLLGSLIVFNWVLAYVFKRAEHVIRQ